MTTPNPNIISFNWPPTTWEDSGLMGFSGETHDYSASQYKLKLEPHVNRLVHLANQAARAAKAEKECRAMVRMLDDGEWAEHVGQEPVSRLFEATVTKLINEVADQETRAGDWCRRAGRLDDEANRLALTLFEARELLHDFVNCPWNIEMASVPSAGIEAAPEQVVGTMHVALMRLRKVRAFLEDKKVDESIDFNQDVVLEPPPREATNISWEKPLRVSFDGAEGQGRVWLHFDPSNANQDEESVYVAGVDNARKLAKLLNAWADSYTGDKS